MIPVYGITNALHGFSQKCNLYEIFSFPGSFEVFKYFTTVLLEWDVPEAWQVNTYVHIHHDIHKTAQSKWCGRQNMHVLVVVQFSA